MCEQSRSKLPSSLLPGLPLQQTLEHGIISKRGVQERRASSSTDAVQPTDFSDTLPEVELCSVLTPAREDSQRQQHLTTQRVSTYRLRLDPFTSQSGYAHSDFKYVQYPAVNAQTSAAAIACSQLTPDQAEAALQYFVLCGERVSQMTRTYDDVNCLTDLLQEKERDLELAAIIGKSLLDSNRVLKSRNEELETTLKTSEDACGQLSHDLRATRQFLSLYTNEDDKINAGVDAEASLDDEDNSLTGPLNSSRRASAVLKTTLIRQLETTLRDLRAENEQLRSRTERLQNDTTGIETKEYSLVQQCVRELTEANERVRQLNGELDQRTEDDGKVQTEKERLQATIVGLERKLKAYVSQVDELNQNLALADEAEKYLIDEYEALQSKYEHVCECFQALQDDIRVRRRRSGSLGGGSTASSSRQVLNDDDDAEDDADAENVVGDKILLSPRRRKNYADVAANDNDDDGSEAGCGGDGSETRTAKRRGPRSGAKNRTSLAASMTLASQLATSKEAMVSRSDTLRKLMETVRCARLNGESRHAWHRTSTSLATSAATVSVADRILSSAAGRRLPTDSGTCSDLESPLTAGLLQFHHHQQRHLLTPSSSSMYSERSGGDVVSDSQSLAQYDQPRRLAFLTESSGAEETEELLLGERQAELLVSRKKSELDRASASHLLSAKRNNNNNSMCAGEYVTAGGGGSSKISSYAGQLEIVKPLEGSLTLYQWSRLCVPRMADINEERDGVHTKGENNAGACRSQHSSTITPSASGADFGSLLSSYKTVNSTPAVLPSSVAAEKCRSNNNNNNGVDAQHADALVEQLLINIASRNRMQRTGRLQQLHQQRSNSITRSVEDAESALASSMDESSVLSSASGIESPAHIDALPTRASGGGRVLTRADLILHNKHASPLHAVGKISENATTPVNMPIVVGNESPLTSKRSPFRHVIGAKQTTAGVVKHLSPLFRKDNNLQHLTCNSKPTAVSSAGNNNNNSVITVQQGTEAASETDSID